MSKKKSTTPAGGAVPARALTEEFEVGYAPHHPLQSYYSDFYTGDPASRYGRRRSARSIPPETMLEMLVDHRVAIGELFVRTPLLNAPWRIECSDPDVKAFLEAVWSPLHDLYYRLATKAVMLGYLPMVKYLEFGRPTPTEGQAEEGVDPWTSSVEPLIVTRLQVLHPRWSRPYFDPKTKRFAGIDLVRIPTISGNEEKGILPPENSVWVTRGQDDAFGDWYGQGRLVTAYSPWWDGAFVSTLYLRHCERTIDPSIIVKHPPGYKADPNSPASKGTPFSQVAMETGQALRSGATVTIPSEPYKTDDGSYTSIPMWDVDTALGELENVASFETVLTRLDADVLLGLLIPPAALSSKYTKETLGGKSMTEILGELATTMLLLEWVNLANNAEKWILEPLARWNFGEDAPTAQLVTDGFREEDVEMMTKVIDALVRAGQWDSDVIDIRELATRAGLPVRDVDAEPREGDGDGDGDGDQGGAQAAQLAREDPDVRLLWETTRLTREGADIEAEQVKVRDRLERAMVADLVPFFRGQAERAIARGAEVSGRLSLARKDPKVDLGKRFWEEEAARLLAELMPHLTAGTVAGVEGGNDALRAYFGIGIDWTVVNQPAIAWARGYGFGLITDLTDTTRRFTHEEMVSWIQEDIVTWIEDGDPLPDLVDRLVTRGLGKARAELIASTEVTRVYAEGNLLTWRESGYVSGKRWRTAVDELVCPYCGGLHDELVELDVEFHVEPEGLKPLDVGAPPAHPRCRCWLQPVLEKVG